MEFLSVILFFLLVLSVSFALGRKILALMGIKLESSLENFVFSFPLGMSVLAYMTFFLGIMGLLYKSVLIAALLIIFIILIKDIRSTALMLFNFANSLNIKNIIKKHRSGLNFFSVLAAFLFLFAALNFIISFSPPWHYDVAAYHLAVSKIYIREHQIIYLPYIFFSNLPPLVDSISLMGLLLHSGILSNLFGYSLGIAFLLAIYSFCRRFFNRMVAMLASLIFYSMPMVIGLSSTAHVDVQFALFIFLSFYGLFLYFNTENYKNLALCAIFAGFGVVSKIFGAVAASGILLLLAIHTFHGLAKKKFNYKTALGILMIFCFIAAAVALPWLLKNYFYTGNPLWPAFNEVFHGKYWDRGHQEDLSHMINIRQTSLINYLRLPLDIHTQAGKDIGNIDEDEGIGPYFLAFLPLYFFLRRKNRIIDIFFIMLLVYITMWFFLSYFLRYLIFIMPMVAIISGYVIAELAKNKYLSKILKILLVLTFSFNFLIWFGSNAKEIPVAIGLESKNDFYLKYPGPIYRASQFINSNLPENSKILLFRDNRGLFLDRDYVWGDPLLQLYIDYSQFENEDDFYEKLKSIGVTHILVNTKFKFREHIVNDYRYSEKILNMTGNLLEKHTTNLYDKDAILINELK